MYNIHCYIYKIKIKIKIYLDKSSIKYIIHLLVLCCKYMQSARRTQFKTSKTICYNTENKANTCFSHRFKVECLRVRKLYQFRPP